MTLWNFFRLSAFVMAATLDISSETRPTYAQADLKDGKRSTLLFRIALSAWVMAALTTQFLMASIGPASAITSGVTCAPAKDSNPDPRFLRDVVAQQTLESTPVCKISTGISNNNAGAGTPMLLLLNTNSTNPPLDLDGFRISYASSVSNVSVNGTAVTGGEFVQAVPTPTSFTVQYDFGGNTYHFKVTATPDHGSANANTLSGFTIMAGPASNGTTMVTPQNVITSFMTNRANHILNNQPNLAGFVTGQNISGGGPLGYLALNGNDASQTMTFSTSRSRMLAASNGEDEKRNQTILHTANNRIDAAFGEPVATTPASGPALAASNQHHDDGINSHLLGFSPADDGRVIVKDTGTETYGFDTNAEDELVGNRAGTWDVWTEIYGARADTGTATSSLWVGYVGAHYFVEDNKLIGLLGQFDWAEESDSITNASADGTGWMIGPYIAGKFDNHQLFYEVSIRYGQSDNTISPIGTYEDDFDTTRWMVSGKLSGVMQHDDITIRPELSATWYEETQESYTDSLANAIPEQTISLGELQFGPRFERTTTLDNGTVFTPSLGMTGVYNFDLDSNNVSQATTLGTEQLRARLSAGFVATNPDSQMSFAVEGYYDGIFISDYDAYGARARLTVPLN